MKIDLSEGNNMSSCKNIDLGFATSSALKESRANDRDLYQFREECKQFVLELLKKLNVKSPLNYSLVRNVSCLDPQKNNKKWSGMQSEVLDNSDCVG